MKQSILTLLLGGAILSTMGSPITVASSEVLRRLAPVAVDFKEAGEEVLLVEEDFAGMAAGSESEPDSENIADKRTGSIPSQYTRIPGWSGAAVYQAGGACAILLGKYSDGMGGYVEDTGFIRTPQGNYAGNLTLTFRAKLIADSGSDRMDVAIINSNGRLESKNVTVTPEWTDYTLNFTKGDFTGCMMQFAMISKEVLIDDIRISTQPTAIPAPLATHISDYSVDGFTAHWSKVNEAADYQVTIYEKKTEEAIIIEDFTDLNILEGTCKLDKTNPGFTEGWDVTFGTVRNSDHVSDLGYEGSIGMIFRATGEGFQTPVYERPIKDFSFYAAHPSGVECLSTLVVSVLVDGEWGALGNYDVERISPEGEIIRLSSNFPEGVKSVKITFRKNEQYDAGKDVSVVIDHIRMMVDPEGVPVDSYLTEELQYEITGLDAYKDYSFTVKALNGEFESAESNEITASGLAAPALLSPEELTETSYIARWEPSPKAEGYRICNYSVYRVAQDGEEVDILYENFDKVNEGTFLNPVGLYNVVHPRLLDDYTINPGWYGIATYLVNGMLGTRSYMGITGMIQTPVLDLSNANGSFEVKVKVIGDSDATDEYLVVQAGYAEYQKLKIKPAEMVELEFHFDCGEQQMPLAFYSYNGYPFYIDEVSVKQTLDKDTKVFTEVSNVEKEGNDDLENLFENLTFSNNRYYAYRVFAYRDFMGSRKYSVSDDVKEVSQTNSIKKINSIADTAEAEYYTLDGIKLSGAPAAPGLYLKKHGSHTEKLLVK